jgi:hypothetical protein
VRSEVRGQRSEVRGQKKQEARIKDEADKNVCPTIRIAVGAKRVELAEAAAAVVADAEAVAVFHFLDEASGEVVVEHVGGDLFVGADDVAADDVTAGLVDGELVTGEESGVEGVGVEDLRRRRLGSSADRTRDDGAGGRC